MHYHAVSGSKQTRTAIHTNFLRSSALPLRPLGDEQATLKIKANGLADRNKNCRKMSCTWCQKINYSQGQSPASSGGLRTETKNTDDSIRSEDRTSLAEGNLSQKQPPVSSWKYSLPPRDISRRDRICPESPRLVSYRITTTDFIPKPSATAHVVAPRKQKDIERQDMKDKSSCHSSRELPSCRHPSPNSSTKTSHRRTPQLRRSMPPSYLIASHHQHRSLQPKQPVATGQGRGNPQRQTNDNVSLSKIIPIPPSNRTMHHRSPQPKQ